MISSSEYRNKTQFTIDRKLRLVAVLADHATRLDDRSFGQFSQGKLVRLPDNRPYAPRRISEFQRHELPAHRLADLFASDRKEPLDTIVFDKPRYFLMFHIGKVIGYRASGQP